MKTSWLWENFWSQGKKVRDLNLEFRELIEKLDEDYDLFLKTRKKGEEVFAWDGLSREELAKIRDDVDLLRAKIKTLFNHSHIREEAKKAWGIWWSQKVWRIITGFLPTLEREINREMLFLHGDPKDLVHIRDTDWNPRRKIAAEEKLRRTGTSS